MSTRGERANVYAWLRDAGVPRALALLVSEAARPGKKPTKPPALADQEEAESVVLEWLQSDFTADVEGVQNLLTPIYGLEATAEMFDTDVNGLEATAWIVGYEMSHPTKGD